MNIFTEQSSAHWSLFRVFKNDTQQITAIIVAAPACLYFTIIIIRTVSMQ